MRFADIPGHDELKRRLARNADEGRISHAQLFTGICGAGTLPLAAAYAQYINCTCRRDGDSCGECPSCRQAEALAHPDIHFVFPVNKLGKKSGEAVLSGEFMPQWRELFSRTGGFFSPQQWFDTLNLGKTLKGVISAKESDEIIRTLSFKSFESEYKTMIVWMPETMNDGIVPIASDVGDYTKYYLRDGENSLFIPGDGEEACARAIRRALALFPQGFPELSRAARRCVEQKFDYHVWAPTLRAMIEQTAGRGAQRNEGGGCDAGKHHHGRV